MLGGVLQRWDHDTANLILYIRNPQKFLAEHDPDSYIRKLYKKFGNMAMTGFPDINDTDMILLIDYIDGGRY
jgi:ribosome biogenesis GTPase A